MSAMFQSLWVRKLIGKPRVPYNRGLRVRGSSHPLFERDYEPFLPPFAVASKVFCIQSDLLCRAWPIASLARIFRRIGRVHGEPEWECVWRDAKHGARDARAPRNRGCPVRCTGNGEEPKFASDSGMSSLIPVGESPTGTGGSPVPPTGLGLRLRLGLR
jgi:hypothetical protein